MADGKIYITITDEPLTKPEPGTPQPPKPEGEKDDKNSLFSDFAKHQFFEFIKAQSKQFINYTIGNIGNFTGNYQSQRQIQETISIGNRIANVGMAAIAGAKYGVAGAIIGAVVSIASQGIELGLQDHTLGVQVKQQNREIDMMRKISGLDGLTNGSRWGQ